MKPGTDLDILVAEKIMGWTYIGMNDRPDLQCIVKPCWLDEGDHVAWSHLCTPIWSPSTNIAHAWQLVRRMKALKRRSALWWNYTGGSFICIDIGADKEMTLGEIMFKHPDKMPLAICLAALHSFGVLPNASDQRAWEPIKMKTEPNMGKIITVKWDAQDKANEGWAYDVRNGESGAVDGHAADAIDRICESIKALEGDGEAIIAATGAERGDQLWLDLGANSTIDLSGHLGLDD